MAADLPSRKTGAGSEVLVGLGEFGSLSLPRQG